MYNAGRQADFAGEPGVGNTNRKTGVLALGTIVARGDCATGWVKVKADEGVGVTVDVFLGKMVEEMAATVGVAVRVAAESWDGKICAQLVSVTDIIRITARKAKPEEVFMAQVVSRLGAVWV